MPGILDCTRRLVNRILNLAKAARSLQWQGEKVRAEADSVHHAEPLWRVD